MVEALGISLKEFIFYLINFAILVAVLKIFLYKPFMDNLDKRKKAIQDSLDTADETKRLAEEKLADYEKRIADAEHECAELIRAAKMDAGNEAKEILNQANAKADQIMKSAHREIEAEKVKAMKKMRKEISELAMLAAAQIVEHDVAGDERQNEIIDSIIEDRRGSTWQS